MKELSIFIDESGDFGEYKHHSPYYIITMFFHNQAAAIDKAVARLEDELNYIKTKNHCVHTGPVTNPHFKWGVELRLLRQYYLLA